MQKIKTKDAVKGTIKAIDKASVAAQRMKTAYVATKEKAETSVYRQESSVDEYAADNMQSSEAEITHEAVYAFEKIGQRSVKKTKGNTAKVKDKVQAFKEKRIQKTIREENAESGEVTKQYSAVANHVTNVPDTCLDHVLSQEDGPLYKPTATRLSEGGKCYDTPIRTAESKKKAARQLSGDSGKFSVKNKKHNPPIRTSYHATRTVQQSAGASMEKTAGTIKQSARASGKMTIKTVGMGGTKAAGKSVKTAERTAKTAIKTTEQAVRGAQKTARVSVKTAQRTVQAAKATARAAAVGLKSAARATVATIKALIAATKGLISAIVAGGWVAISVIVVICLVAMMASSVFGIFFSGESSDDSDEITMQMVVQEINSEYDSEVQSIKDSATYDNLEMSGSRAVWKEVLSVYAVKTNMNESDPKEVATMDDGKKDLLSDIFWEMNSISSRTETIEETIIEETDDGEGNIVETEKTITRTTLYITVSHKTIDEMAQQYGFSAEQKGYLSELLRSENNSMWSSVLYGIKYTDDQIVTVALSQVGNVGGDPYWSWYGFNSRVEWCAVFVSWCANECGYIDSGIIPKYAGCVNGAQWFKDRGQWASGTEEPVAGMIIFFDWDSPTGPSGPQDGEADHTAIVQKVENGIVYTVEGNMGDRVQLRQYPVGYYEILGYGIPAY